MCKELTEELVIGTYLAKELVSHVNRMGASKGTIPIKIGESQYEVIVIRVETLDKK